MLVFATLHMPGLNPVGPPSILAAVVVLFLAGLTSGLIPLSPTARRRWTIAAAILVFTIATLTGQTLICGWLRLFPDADDYAAGIIYVVMGLVFATQCLRYASWFCRIEAAVFGLVFGIEIVFRAVSLQSGRSSWTLGTVILFCLAWVVAVALLLWCLRAKWRIHDETEAQPGEGRFQFTLRGLLTAVLVVGMILGLCRGMLDSVKRHRLAVHKFRLEQELHQLNFAMLYARQYLDVKSDRDFPSSGDQIVEYLKNDSRSGGELIAYLQSAGLDIAEIDAEEATVFWLNPLRSSVTSTLPTGGNPSQSLRHDWPACFEFESSDLVDRDGDNWPECVFESWGPEYPEKVFRLEGGRIVARDTTPHQATGIRKAYALDEEGELESFVVDDSPP